MFLFTFWTTLTATQLTLRLWHTHAWLWCVHSTNHNTAATCLSKSSSGPGSFVYEGAISAYDLTVVAKVLAQFLSESTASGALLSFASCNPCVNTAEYRCICTWQYTVVHSSWNQFQVCFYRFLICPSYVVGDQVRYDSKEFCEVGFTRCSIGSYIRRLVSSNRTCLMHSISWWEIRRPLLHSWRGSWDDLCSSVAMETILVCFCVHMFYVRIMVLLLVCISSNLFFLVYWNGLFTGYGSGSFTVIYSNHLWQLFQ